MSELILAKIPVHVEATSIHPAIDAERVIGVLPAQSPAILEYGYRPSGREREEVISFPDDIPDRITDFYAQTIALEPEKRPFYDCHLFAFYALGKALKIKEYTALRVTSISPVETTSTLEPGEAYMTTLANGTPNHSVLGIGKAAYNISVIGENMPMLVGHNSDILNLYGATQINHIQTGPAIE